MRGQVNHKNDVVQFLKSTLHLHLCGYHVALTRDFCDGYTLLQIIVSVLLF